MYYVFVIQFLIIIFSLTILVESHEGRYAHASAIVNNQLYIIGGATSASPQGTNEAFSLDLTQSFETQGPPWVDAIGLPLAISWASAVVMGGNTILLFGGTPWNQNTGSFDNGENSLYQLNVTSSTKQWSIPTANGKPPIRRREMKMVSDDTNHFYIYGGIQLPELAVNPQWFSDMYMLDTSQPTFNWVLTQMTNAPGFPIVDYTATLLPTGVIVYIGGRTQAMSGVGTLIQTELPMNKIFIFDTKDDTWYPMNTTGETVEGRSYHTAILTQDGRIIIYGGTKGDMKITASPSLAVLNTNLLVFAWSIPPTSSNNPPSLMLHTADLFGNRMIISYGNITDEVAPPAQINPNIYILDITSYTWLTSYTPSQNDSNKPSNNNNQSTSIGLILGVVSAGIVFIIVVGVIIALTYRKIRKRRNENIIRIPGSNVDENSAEGGGSEMRESVYSETVDDNNRNSVINRNGNTLGENLNVGNVTNGDYNIRNSALSDNPRDSTSPMLSQSRPTSYNDNSSYIPIGGISFHNPPYGSRNN